MKKDISWRGYFADASRYADAINGFGCKGEQIVSAEDLQEVDTQLEGVRLPKFVHHFSRVRTWNRTKFKDMARKVAFGVNFAIVGIEHQETIDYSIPLRKMIYEVAEYEKQAVKIRKKVRKNREGLTAGEYLYGFRKDSKLFPAITFILYSGIEEWTGPTCLHDMLDFTDIPESIHELVSDYKVYVINLRKITDTSIFKTDLRHVIDFLRYAEDKNKLKELVQNEPYYQEMEEDAYDVVANYADAPGLLGMKEYYMKEGKVDMCKGLKDWLEEVEAEGKAEGIIKILRKYHVSDDEIIRQLMEELGVSEEKAREYLNSISNVL